MSRSERHAAWPAIFAARSAARAAAPATRRPTTHAAAPATTSAARGTARTDGDADASRLRSAATARRSSAGAAADAAEDRYEEADARARRLQKALDLAQEEIDHLAAQMDRMKRDRARLLDTLNGQDKILFGESDRPDAAPATRSRKEAKAAAGATKAAWKQTGGAPKAKARPRPLRRHPPPLL